MRRRLTAALCAMALGVGGAGLAGCGDDDKTEVRSPESKPATNVAGKQGKSLGGAPPGNTKNTDSATD